MSNTPKAVGVDFGASSIKISVCQASHIIHRAQPLITAEYDSPTAIIRAMCECITQLRVTHPDIVAVGLGMPGWVDFKRGVLYHLTNVPVWNHEVPVCQLMREELGLPIAMDNDANCMAYAEWKLGAGRGMESLVNITLGTGIGGGIIVANQLLRGRHLSTGEIGMMSIDYQGKVGPFGNKGGIEEYLGCNEMAADALERYRHAGIEKSLDECMPFPLELAARGGDRIALQVYDDFTEKLASLLMGLMFTLTPDAFILGGGIAKAGDLLFPPLLAKVKAQLPRVYHQHLRIIPAHFANDAGMIGAAMMACEEAGY